MSKEISLEPTEQPRYCQGTALGKPFRRQFIPLPDGQILMRCRRVEVVLVYDEETGCVVPIKRSGREHPPIGDFPTIPLGETAFLRGEMCKRDIVTVRKKGASNPFTEVDPSRGRFQISKNPDSFAFNREGPQITKPDNSFALRRT